MLKTSSRESVAPQKYSAIFSSNFFFFLLDWSINNARVCKHFFFFSDRCNRAIRAVWCDRWRHGWYIRCCSNEFFFFLFCFYIVNYNGPWILGILSLSTSLFYFLQDLKKNKKEDDMIRVNWELSELHFFIRNQV